MNPFRADLHCHSTCSDGTLSPTEIVHLAKQIGLSGLSITDHDTVEAYPIVIEPCLQMGIQLLVGAEFSTVLNGSSVHILGYGFRYDNIDIKTLCIKHTERRLNRNLSILNLLAKNGMPVSEEELTAACVSIPEDIARHTVGRPHIALAMVRKGYVATVQEAFKKYLSDGMPCYIQGTAITVEETIEVIHGAKGIAVIAHPHLVHDRQLVRKLLTMDFDGIECYYGRFYPQHHREWLKIAEKKKWLVTGGSDFHGSIKPDIHLGCSWIGEEQFLAIQTRLHQMH